MTGKSTSRTYSRMIDPTDPWTEREASSYIIKSETEHVTKHSKSNKASGPDQTQNQQS